MKTAAFVVLLALAAVEAGAQSLPFDSIASPLPTAGERKAADIASWITVGAALVLDAHASTKDCQGDACLDALAVAAARVGVTWGATALVKHFVQRERPCAPSCGIDSSDSSFYSMHTAFAFSAMGGPRLAISLPLAISTGGLRIAAGKHYLSDVLVGAAVGAAAGHWIRLKE